MVLYLEGGGRERCSQLTPPTRTLLPSGYLEAEC